MKAAVLTDHEEVTVEERDRPTPEANEVVVHVGACGVCMTDYHMYHGTFPTDHPVIPGHESAGEVVSVGDDVESVAVGDRVAVNPSIPCHECRYCKRGRENLCENFTSLGGAGDRILDGAFAEYAAAPAGSVENIGDLSYRTAAFAEPLACCINGIDRARLTTGDTVVVIGAGPIGLMLTQTLRASGAGTIVVSEPVDHRRAFAAEYADQVVDPTEAPLEDALDGVVERVDIAIEAIGLPETIEQAQAITSPGGTTLVFGVPPQGETIEVDPFAIYYDELELVGTYSLTPGRFARAVTFLQEERIDVDALVTDEFGLDGLTEAFGQMAGHEGLKKMVYPGE